MILTKEIADYCKLNDINDVEAFTQSLLKKGFDIEKYGLLDDSPNVMVKEVIKEVPVEIIKEVIKEVPKVEYVEKIVHNSQNEQKLQETIMKLKQDIIEKDKKINELEKTLEGIDGEKEKVAFFLRGSDLNELI